MDFTTEQIQQALDRAKDVDPKGRDVYPLSSMLEQFQVRGSLSPRQKDYLESLIARYSDKQMEKFKNWKNQWKDPDFRERAEVVANYYLVNSSWFRTEAADTLSFIQGRDQDVPSYRTTQRMLFNEYADKVWASHKAPLIWKAGDLVCCRAAAKVTGFTYQIRREGVNVNRDPCMVIETNSKPISNAIKHSEKTGGARWCAINPIGTTHIFHVMEKDLKKYRQPKAKKGAKK